MSKRKTANFKEAATVHLYEFLKSDLQLKKKPRLQQVYTGKQVEDDFFVLDPISRKCNLKEGLSLLFFCSHTPCGDASIVPMKDCGSELQPTRQVEESVSGVEDEGEPPRKMARKDDVHR